MKSISYNFRRKIQGTRRDGYFLEHIITGERTGFIFDESIKKLERGEPLLRTVSEVKPHEIYTQEFTDAPIWQRLFRLEQTGKIQDPTMMEQPFEQGDTIKITMKKEADNIITVKIKLMKER